MVNASFTGINLDPAAADGMFKACFGNLPDGHVYMDMLSTAKTEAKSRFSEKAQAEVKSRLTEVKDTLDTSSPLFATGTYYSGTSGSIPVLHPIIWDDKLYDKTTRDYPLASGLIPKVANKGIFASYVRRTALPTAAWRPQGAAQTADKSTYDLLTKKISCIYSVGEISGLVMADNTWIDRLSLEKEAHYRAVVELMENTMVKGDVSSSTYLHGFDGFSAAVTTNTSNQSGAAIALSTIDTALRTIREAKGDPDLIVTDWKTFYDVKALLKPYITMANQTSRLNAFGFNAIDYMGIPIVVSLSMPTSGSGREMHIYTVGKQGNVQLRMLQDIMFEEKPSSADSYRFMLKAYFTMIFVFEDWCYRIYGLE